MDSRINKAVVLHKTDGSMVRITPTSKWLYHYKIDSNVGNMWSLVTTVADKADKYTQCTIQRAQDARRFQNIIMRPRSGELMDVAVTHLKGCSITRGDVIAAEDIIGPNLGALKGKTVSRPGQHVWTGIDPVPYKILNTHRSIALAIDIMFVNSVAFLLTTSHNLKFGTVEALENRQVTTIVRELKTIERLYHQRGLRIESMLANPEFEPLRTEFVDRNPSTTPGADPPRDARDSGSARSHSTHLETSSSDRPKMVTYTEPQTVSSYMSVTCTRWTLRIPNFTRATHAQPSLSDFPWQE